MPSRVCIHVLLLLQTIIELVLFHASTYVHVILSNSFLVSLISGVLLLRNKLVTLLFPPAVSLV